MNLFSKIKLTNAQQFIKKPSLLKSFLIILASSITQTALAYRQSLLDPLSPEFQLIKNPTATLIGLKNPVWDDLKQQAGYTN